MVIMVYWKEYCVEPDIPFLVRKAIYEGSIMV